LKPNKRETFLEDAFAEFSLKGFYGASITQLVKSLRIAKGSIYQYFQNKEDLYEYLVKEACRRKLAFFEVLRSKGEANYSLNYLVISAKFDLTFISQAMIIYQGMSSSMDRIHQNIQELLINRIPAPDKYSHANLQITLFMHSQALLQLLLTTHKISTAESILSKEPVPMVGSRIVEIAQEFLNSLNSLKK